LFHFICAGYTPRVACFLHVLPIRRLTAIPQFTGSCSTIELQKAFAGVVFQAISHRLPNDLLDMPRGLSDWHSEVPAVPRNQKIGSP
jgi:hypothetical protein